MIKKVSGWFKILKRKIKRSKKITLPSREEMLKRFTKKDGNGHRQKYFYLSLLKEAGQRKNAEGVFKMLLLAIADYLQKVAVHARGMEAGIIFTRAGDIVDMLVEDKEVSQEATGLLEITAEELFDTVIYTG